MLSCQKKTFILDYFISKFQSELCWLSKLTRALLNMVATFQLRVLVFSIPSCPKKLSELLFPLLFGFHLRRPNYISHKTGIIIEIISLIEYISWLVAVVRTLTLQKRNSLALLAIRLTHKLLQLQVACMQSHIDLRSTNFHQNVPRVDWVRETVSKIQRH